MPSLAPAQAYRSRLNYNVFNIFGETFSPPFSLSLSWSSFCQKQNNCNGIFLYIFLPVFPPLIPSWGSQVWCQSLGPVGRGSGWEPRIVLRGGLRQASLSFPFSLIEATWPGSFQASNFRGVCGGHASAGHSVLPSTLIVLTPSPGCRMRLLLQLIREKPSLTAWDLELSVFWGRPFQCSPVVLLIVLFVQF